MAFHVGVHGGKYNTSSVCTSVGSLVGRCSCGDVQTWTPLARAWHNVARPHLLRCRETRTSYLRLQERLLPGTRMCHPPGMAKTRDQLDK
eukprot:scaffold663035_cov92-Prasinocladus_malaysianus.AAC.1